ncbi:MAG TPA: hydantoinase B/oxoprolinase family protein [Chloroflexota bacterium]|nr:hydantoinase B/oxoprolinase family protein [Chloroflexota bacterium]
MTMHAGATSGAPREARRAAPRGPCGPARRVDPVTLEVVRNALVAYADEMSTVLSRTAYNMMIYEVHDYCVGLIDTAGQIIAQNTGGLPIFLADLGVAIVDGVRTFGLDGFAPGDVVLMNYPYICGQHLNNVVVYTPFFFEGELLAFPAVRAHWVDIGSATVGFGPGGTTEIYQEGLQLRSVKLYEAGKLNDSIERIIHDNVRLPEAALGDLRAQIAACRVGERRLHELFARYGKETVLACIQEIWDQTEQLTRQAVARIPNGVYTAESFIDGHMLQPPRPIPIKVRVEVADDELTVDYSEISEQLETSLNAGESGGIAAARVAFKAITLPHLPVNEGAFRPLHVVLPPGKLLSAQPPAAVGNWSLSLPTVVDTILLALADALPDLIPAGHKADMGGYTFYGMDRERGRRFICMNILGGGWGGRPHEDGPSAAVSICQGDVRNVPLELQEAYYPLLFERFRLRPDSGGAGKHRGGLGLELRVRALQDLFVNRSLERVTCRPWGLRGGRPGAPPLNIVERTDGTREEIARGISRFPLAAGDVLTILTAGGGGWGDPRERDPQRLAEDLRLGYVTPAGAAEYGVTPDAADAPAAAAPLRPGAQHGG